MNGFGVARRRAPRAMPRFVSSGLTWLCAWFRSAVLAIVTNWKAGLAAPGRA